MLCHLTTADAWERALRDSEYAPESLLADGFVHLSDPEQVEDTFKRFFTGRTDVILLKIDEKKLKAPVRREDLYGHGEFPHLYGPLNLDAVTSAEPL